MLNLDHFIAECRAALTQHSPDLVIKEILERAVAHPSEMETALGTPREGKIVTLHHDCDLTILNVVWTPVMAAYPHDRRMWALIGLYGGREDNTFYRRSPEGLQIAGGNSWRPGTPRSSGNR
jgi:predicted metal-dependent enzyme (double-stranded beta helix superfamily)